MKINIYEAKLMTICIEFYIQHFNKELREITIKYI